MSDDGMDFFAELEAEIAVATAATAQKAARDAAKKRANTMSLPPAVRAKATEEFKELSAILAALEWQSVATAALISEQSCDGCGSTHRTFLQYMELQQMKSRATTQRWIRVPRPMEGLRRTTMIQPLKTHICPDCIEDHGFDGQDSLRLVVRQDQLAISNTYLQEDINGTSA